MAADDLKNCAIANGNVAAATYMDVVAPYSGTLTSFDLANGDSVTAGQTIMTMQTLTVYAPEDGKVTAVFAQPGDDATALMSRYGALVSIEPAQKLRLEASTANAYDSEANRIIHVGETLYFEDGDNVQGEGRVIMVQGAAFVVDVLSGNYEDGQALSLFRNSNYTSKKIQ